MVNELPIHSELERAAAAHRAGQFADAAAAYESVLAREPNHPDALHLLGLAKHQSGDSDRGIELIQRAVELNPHAADFHANLAGIFSARGRLSDAVASMQRASGLRPGDERLQRRLGQHLTRLGVERLDQDRLADAAATLERAVAIRPDAADALGNLGLALARMKHYGPAIERYRQALAIDPDVAEVHTNLGAAYLAIGRPDEAAAAHRRALELRPNWPAATANLAIALGQLAQTDEALALHESVLRENPNDATSLFNRGLIRLARGDFLYGWRDYEARFRVPELKGQRTFAQPRWNGEDIAGRTLLVHAEQGLGDAIQFARYVLMLVERGARVILLCDPLLARLMRTSFPDVQVVPNGETFPPFDLHVPIMSLPFAFGTTLETIPMQTPYLKVPADVGAKFADLFDDGEHLHVGFVWSGNPGHYNDRNRSIPLERVLHSIPDDPRFILYSLQKGPGAEQLASARRPLTDLAPRLTDLADSAAAIQMLDLVITVDTSIAHLAGAVAADTWTLLPEPADFRWLIAREDSPWYYTMRLFRQRRAGDWDEVLRRVGNELASLARLGKP